MSNSNDLSNPFVGYDLCQMIAHSLEGVGFHVGRTVGISIAQQIWRQDTEAFCSQRVYLVAPIVAPAREAMQEEKGRLGSGGSNVDICVTRAIAQLDVLADGWKT